MDRDEDGLVLGRSAAVAAGCHQLPVVPGFEVPLVPGRPLADSARTGSRSWLPWRRLPTRWLPADSWWPRQIPAQKATRHRGSTSERPAAAASRARPAAERTARRHREAPTPGVDPPPAAITQARRL